MYYKTYSNIEKRDSKDIVNEYGERLPQFCKWSGFRLLNGRLDKDKHISDFTCCTSAGGNIVDYVMCRENEFKFVTLFGCRHLQRSIDFQHVSYQFWYLFL